MPTCLHVSVANKRRDSSFFFVRGVRCVVSVYLFIRQCQQRDCTVRRHCDSKPLPPQTAIDFFCFVMRIGKYASPQTLLIVSSNRFSNITADSMVIIYRHVGDTDSVYWWRQQAVCLALSIELDVTVLDLLVYLCLSICIYMHIYALTTESISQHGRLCPMWCVKQIRCTNVQMCTRLPYANGFMFNVV